MNSSPRRIAFLTAAALTATAGIAAAQPSSGPVDTEEPPATHDWNEVSHINGQLVPVGEKNEYTYDYKKTNISTNPVGLMLGFYGLSVSQGLNQHVAVRADINYINIVDSDEEMFEAGVGVPLYLRRTYQGPFVEPGVIVRTSKGCDECDTSKTVGPQVLFGWHRSWDSGFNVAAAAGFGRDLDSSDEYHDEFGDSDDEADVFFNGYFRVGYAF